jgi:hydroxypyruvate isomerase
VTVGNTVAGEKTPVTRKRLLKNLKLLGKLCQDSGLIALVEPLNSLVDHKGYFLNRMDDAAELINDAGSKNLKILMDLYHQQVTEGNIISNITKYAGMIGHFHSAGVPGRHELTDGELNYRTVTEAIKKTGYAGFLGLEYKPLKESGTSLYETAKFLTT